VTTDVTLKVTNLREFHSALRKLDATLAKELRVGLKGIAVKAAALAAPWVPKKSGRAASTLKGVGTGTGARITFGGNKAPYAPWLDFGGAAFHARGVTPGGPPYRRRFVAKGRYVYEAIKEGAPQALSDLQDLMNDIAAREGWT